MTILDETTDLIRLYEHLCGESEVPKEYHQWAFLSLLASRVEDRVWLEKDKGNKLTPLLYVFLVGPPALGKGVAIGKVLKLGALASNGCIKSFNGSVTAAHLTDVLGGGKDSNFEDAECLIANPKLWLVMDELGADIGKGAIADSFIKLMTKLYTSPTGVPIDTGTRSHGSVRIVDPAVNWLAGTTDEWLIGSLTQESIYAGPTSRIVFVKAHYDLHKRYRRAVYPKDYDEVYEYIVAGLTNLQYRKGEFKMTDEAILKEDTWYMNRPAPVEALVIPSWKREQDLILKLAMLMVLSEGGPLVIDVRHIVRAMQASRAVQHNVSKVIELASKNTSTNMFSEVESQIKRIGKVQHTFLSRLMRRRGITPKILKEIIESLAQEGQVKLSWSSTNAKQYEWVKEEEGK